MSLLSDYLQKHPPVQVEPNWMIKGVTEQAITEMSAAIEEECREKGVNEVNLVLYCYIDGECRLVDGKRVALPWNKRKSDAYNVKVTERTAKVDKALVEAKCCDVCKHCFYTGLPGAFACEFKGFTDIFDTCDKWELSDEIGAEDENAR